GIALPVLAEGYPGMSAVGLDVSAQRRHLIAAPVGDHGDGAVLLAGRHGTKAGALRPLLSLIWRGGRRDVDVGYGLAKQRVAHRAACNARLLAVCGQRRE